MPLRSKRMCVETLASVDGHWQIILRMRSMPNEHWSSCPQLSAGIQRISVRHPRQWLAGIHPKCRPDGCPITNVGHDEEERTMFDNTCRAWAINFVILIHSAKLRTGSTKDLAEPWPRQPGHSFFATGLGLSLVEWLRMIDSFGIPAGR